MLYKTRMHDSSTQCTDSVHEHGAPGRCSWATRYTELPLTNVT